MAKNKRAKETRENKKKLLPSKSNMRSGGPSVNGQVALASSGQVDEKHDQAHAAVPFDIYGGTWPNTWEPMPDVYPIYNEHFEWSVEENLDPREATSMKTAPTKWAKNSILV